MANNDNQKVLEFGDKVEDGTIYAGVAPDTGEAMYITAALGRALKLNAESNVRVSIY